MDLYDVVNVKAMLRELSLICKPKQNEVVNTWLIIMEKKGYKDVQSKRMS